MLLAPGSVSEMQDYIPENRCYRAALFAPLSRLNA